MSDEDYYVIFYDKGDEEISNTYNEVVSHQKYSGDGKKIYTVDLPSIDGITLSSTEVKYANNAQVAAPVSANGKQVTDFILLPQTLDNVQLRVTFTLQNDQMAAPIQQVLTKKLITDKVTEWHEGSRYTYNVAVALDEIYFEPTVTDWVNVNVTDLPNL